MLTCLTLCLALQTSPAELAAAEPDPIVAKVADGAAFLVRVQEGSDNAEWPYEGVYRVRGRTGPTIPIGYRVGGTGICALALLHAPGWEDEPDRRAAVRRATEFVCAGIEHPLMSIDDYEGGYDVRAWGYIYGVLFLLDLQATDRVPEGMDGTVKSAIAWYVQAIEDIEIPRAGGWSYSRRALDQVTGDAPFMTGPALQALFAARAAGYTVDDKIIERGLDALERARLDSGAVQYSGGSSRGRDLVPGSVGRMLVSENTLLLGGRGGVDRVRGALDAFLVHWEWLEKRRSQNGTHVAPYGIAPYYFFYAHLYAAQAVELLPEGERAEYRRKVRERLDVVQQKDGTWNDRVFDRSANYGTAIAMLAFTMPERGVGVALEPAGAPDVSE